jgi:hypothetical protein
MNEARDRLKQLKELEHLKRHIKHSIETFERPPESFNPLVASPEELSRFGFSTRPDARLQPVQFSFWERRYAGRKTITYKPFEFSLSPGSFPILFPAVNKRQTGLGARSRHQTSKNWSGAYIKPRDGGMFTFVQAAWQIPALSATTAPELCSTWIGLDGQRRYYHSSLPQIGTAQYSGTSGPVCFAWFQWWASAQGLGSAPVKLPTLPVAAGDSISATLEVVDPQTVKFTIMNESQNIHLTPFNYHPPIGPAPYLVSGATAEWVVERPSLWPTNYLFELPAFGTVVFRDCMAVQTNLSNGMKVERNSNGASLIDMYRVLEQPARTEKIAFAHTTLGGDVLVKSA